jgi:hypothetical protein
MRLYRLDTQKVGKQIHQLKVKKAVGERFKHTLDNVMAEEFFKLKFHGKRLSTSDSHQSSITSEKKSDRNSQSSQLLSGHDDNQLDLL